MPDSLTPLEIWTAKRILALYRLEGSGLSQEDIDLILSNPPRAE